MAVKFFVPLYRSIESPSAYYYLEMRFGSWARSYASVCYLLTQLARMGAILYLMALPMNALFGWSIPMIIIVTGISVMIYATMGGLEAVVSTAAIIDRVKELAVRLGRTPAQVALAWVAGSPGVTAPIIGASKDNHIAEAVAALDLVLDEADRASIEELYRPRPVQGHE